MDKREKKKKRELYGKELNELPRFFRQRSSDPDAFAL